MPDQKDPVQLGKMKTEMPKVSTGIQAGGNGISTNWKDIKWTRNKLVGTTIALGLPYLIAVIGTWTVGAKFFTYVLIGLAMLVGFVFLIIGWIESDEF